MDLNEAETLLKAGWIPRIKTVKGRNYITLRKGVNERSLGPYEKEYWSELSKLSGAKQKPHIEEIEELKDAMAKTNNTIAELRAELEKLKAEKTPNTSHIQDWKASNCSLAETYMEKETFCSKYSWDEEPHELIKLYPNVTFKRSAIKAGDEQQKWRFTPHSDICAPCNPVDNSFFRIEGNTFEDLGRLKDDVAKIKVSFNYLEHTAKRRVRMDIPKWNCKHLGKDGYCTFWSWDEVQPSRLQKKDDQGRWRDNVREHPIICVACPNFELIKEEQKQQTTVQPSSAKR